MLRSLLLLMLLMLPAVLPSPVPATQFWMLAWSNHQMTVLASVPSSSRIECGVRCARRQGCVASSYDATATPLTCRLLACSPGWVPLNADCYVLLSNQLSWLDANVVCIDQLSAHLVSVHSQLENLFVDLLADLHGMPRLHLGLLADGNSQQWTDGSPLDFTNWAAGEGSDVPGQDTGFQPVSASLLAAEGSSWADNSAADVYHVMCKRTKVLPP